MIFLQRRDDGMADVAYRGDAARILKDGAVVVDWTAGGVVPDVPQGGGYTLEIRRGATVTADTLAIGAVVVTAGQSNMTAWFNPYTPVASPADVWMLSGASWVQPSGLGAKSLAATLSDQLGVPVAIVNAAVSGTPLIQAPGAARWWLDTAPGSLYATMLTRLAVAGGRAEYVVWAQGEAEGSRLDISGDQYAAALETLFARVRVDTGTKAIGVLELGTYDVPGRGLNFNTIRAAQNRVAAAWDDVVIGASPLGENGSAGFERTDGLHYTPFSYGYLAARMARSLLAATGRDGALLTLDGGAEADLLAAGDGAYLISGHQGDDIITSGAGDDLIDGGLGADTIDAGDGDNIVRGDEGDDTIVAGAGSDMLSGGFGDDVVRGGAGNDDISGDAGNDRLFGDDGIDQIAGGAGNDWIDGGAGADRMTGGAGDDTFVIDSPGDRAIEDANGGSDTILAGIALTLVDFTEIEHLTLLEGVLSGTGNALANRLTGNAADNRLVGLGGNDTLDGGMGADEMVGGAGDDTYVVDDVRDRALEVAGEGYDTVRASVSYNLAGQFVEALILTGSADIDATGNAQPNTLTGNDGANRLFGGAANDVLSGGAGNDLLDGGTGADRMTGGEGDDVFYVDDAGDRVFETVGGGTDKVFSSVSFSLASQFVEVLTLTGAGAIDATGNSQANTLIGNAAANRLDGGAGGDTLRGGGGADVLIGGAGADRFEFDRLEPDTLDTILDFSPVDDTLYLDRRTFAAAGAYGKLTAAAFVTGSAALDAGDRILYDPGSGLLSFDADGTGALAAVPIVQLSPNLALTAGDVFLF